MYNYSTDFLKQLDKEHNRTTHVRITSLSLNDIPMERIEGRITGGSINIDGKSAIRRSCSLSLLAQEDDTIVTDIYWAYNTKFKLEIGLTNNIDLNYPDIIWFNMGIYVITSFSKSQSTTGLNISLSGKDKMCRLNGEVSGSLPMSTDFGTEEIKYSEDYIEVKKIPIRKIILNAIQEYGQEPLHNIIINDLPDYGYEIWDYRGDNPIYFVLQNNTVVNSTFYFDYLVPDKDKQKDFQFYLLNTLDSSINNSATKINYINPTATEGPNTVAKIEYGETAGYHQTPLVYNSDLILNAGDAVTALLDKLVQMLGDFEYFYDLDGHFVFQKQKTYIQELFSPIDGNLATPIMMASEYSYKFEDKELFTSISDSPDLKTIKNEYSIWGSRKGASGTDIPIHARYAVQKKPTSYISPYPDEIYNDEPYKYYKIPDLHYIKVSAAIEIKNKDEFATQYSSNNGKLYYKEKDKYIFTLTHTFIDNVTSYYTIQEAEENYDPLIDKGTKYHLYQLITNGKYSAYPIGENTKIYNKEYESVTPVRKEGDSSYYIPSALPYYFKEKAIYTTEEYDWREIIYQMAEDFYDHHTENDYYIKLQQSNPWCINGKTGYEQYYSDMQGFWRQLYNPHPTAYDKDVFGEYYKSSDNNYKYWNKNIHIDPAKLNFWFDFLDTGGEIAKYGVDAIGSRPKTINDTKVSSIYYKETPEVLFILPDDDVEQLEPNSYTKIQIQKSTEELFYRSTQGISAIDKVNELINQHLAIAEGVALTSIPIFYLQPNTRIYVDGVGDCTLEKISYNLSYNGTMNLTCNKILQGLN